MRERERGSERVRKRAQQMAGSLAAERARWQAAKGRKAGGGGTPTPPINYDKLLIERASETGRVGITTTMAQR